MLLTGYRKEIVRPECNPNFVSVHCIAHLDEDIGEALPYLNASLGGFQYVKNPPSVTFKAHGKLITVHSRQININALKEEAEADKILKSLIQEINEAWDRRAEIEPSYESQSSPSMLEILKLLPKTNCRECGEPTCMVFAIRVTEGVKGPEDCPPLEHENAGKLTEYLTQFDFEI
jgi:ArsR family metal-binding transcriptional regulator